MCQMYKDWLVERLAKTAYMYISLDVKYYRMIGYLFPLLENPLMPIHVVMFM